MIRRDYILRAIEEFAEVLSRIRAQKENHLWREAGLSLEDEFQRLIGTGPADAVQLSDTELLARIIQGGPTHAVRDRTLMLAALFKEAGDIAAGQDREEDGRACWLKGLHLLLETEERDGIFDRPEFIPGIEAFANALRSAPLPLPTRARLMRHYELAGEFGKAEDALFDLLDAEPNNSAFVQFGIAFYERLQSKADERLAAGNLPRPELESALAELKNRPTSG